MKNDLELLRRFAEQGSQEAFAELVRQKVNLVYAAALRQTGGDGHLAHDVTQGVFLALAGQADVLKNHVLLSGWLYTTTRNLATNAVRTHVRWQRREQEANRMNPTLSGSETAWEQLRPVIDEAMLELPEKDRAALLLRFFEGRSLAEVGAAVGVAENAARMRVARALEKLRGRLAKRGITSTAAALGVTLAEQPTLAAPAELVAAIASSSVAGVVAAGGGALAGVGFMPTAKVIAGLICLTVAAGWGGYAFREAHPNGATNPPSAHPDTGPGTSLLTEENRRSLEENERGQLASARTATARKSANGTSALQRLRWLNEAQKTGLVLKAQVPFATAGGKLHPKFVELFDLSREETEAMQQALDRARQRLAGLALAQATARTTPEGKIVIEVSPFDGGGPIYDEMMDTFAARLGQERNEAFLQLIGGQVGEELNQFGAEQRTITLTPVGERNGRRAYDVLDQHKFANRAAPMPVADPASTPDPAARSHVLGRTSTSAGVTRDALVNRLGLLSKLIPPTP